MRILYPTVHLTIQNAQNVFLGIKSDIRGRGVGSTTQYGFHNPKKTPFTLFKIEMAYGIQKVDTSGSENAPFMKWDQKCI
jgi:hypothetical protein